MFMQVQHNLISPPLCITDGECLDRWMGHTVDGSFVKYILDGNDTGTEKYMPPCPSVSLSSSVSPSDDADAWDWKIS